MRFDIVTIFPEMFESVFGTSILKRAIEDKKVEVRFFNPRDHTTDKHKTVDDTPYGGGPGMVMKIEPLARTLKSIRRKKNSRVFLLSAKGKRFTQQRAQAFAEKYDQLIFVCGRYEGVDERIQEYIDEELSIGDFVLTGGELGAMVIVDAISRLLPGVLGTDESSHEESHSEEGYIEYPHYTRPDVYDGQKVPPVLLSGNHKAIDEWRKEHSTQSKKKS